MCEKSQEKIRRFYSHRSSLILVLYWYKRYSEINISVSLSQTTCRPILFDRCLYNLCCLLNMCQKCVNSVTYHSDKTFNSGHHILYFNFRKGQCVVMQFQTMSNVEVSFSDETHITKSCHLELRSASSKSLITQISGLLYNYPYDYSTRAEEQLIPMRDIITDTKIRRINGLIHVPTTKRIHLSEPLDAYLVNFIQIHPMHIVQGMNLDLRYQRLVCLEDNLKMNHRWRGFLSKQAFTRLLWHWN